MNFDKEGSKFEKKNVSVCVEGRGAWCTDTKTMQNCFFFFFLFFNIFFFFFFMVQFFLNIFFLIFF